MVDADVRRDLDQAWDDATRSAENLLRASPEDAQRATAAMLTLLACQMSELLAIMAHQARTKVHPPVMVVHDGTGFATEPDLFDVVDRAVLDQVDELHQVQPGIDPTVISDNEHVRFQEDPTLVLVADLAGAS